MATKASDEQGDKVPIKVLLDKEKNKVVYIEAGNDFIDVLFSFLTLPLGTIIRFMEKETTNIEAMKVGSLSSLYQSVVDLKEEYLCTHTCKEMLLKPRNSMEAYCKKLKLNIDDTEELQYFICEDCTCPFVKCLTTFRNQISHCGKPMNKVMSPYNSDMESGFVVESGSFIVTDDLHVMPNDIGTIVSLLKVNGINNIESIERKIVLIGKTEVFDLLKLSLLTKTPLTDFIFKEKKLVGNSNPGNENQSEIHDRKAMDGTFEEVRGIDLKLMVRKSSGEIIFGEAKEDFADLLFSFLTFPLGGVLRVLEGISSLGCIDNLYKSMIELNVDEHFRSQGLKEKLALMEISRPFEIRDQIIPIGVAPLRVSDSDDDASILRNFVDPKSPTGESYSSGGFVRGPLKCMVTDDLVVTPMHCMDGFSYLERLKVPLNDLEERVISICVNEALSLLKASLISKSALTNGLNQYITEELLYQKEKSLEVEKVTLQDSILNVAVIEHESEYQKDTYEKLDSEAQQAKKLAAEETETEVFDAANAFSCVPDGIQIPVSHQQNSVEYDASFNNTMVDISSEEISIPTSETMTVAQIIDQETDIETVPKTTTNIENGMNNSNMMMKENMRAGNINSKSISGLKKMLKKLGSYKEGKRVNQETVTKKSK